jgi:cold shock CspA family protein
MKKIGVCISWHGGYGFVRDNKDELDYFVHWSSIIDGSVRWNNLRVGDFVEFEIGPGGNGRIQAINVKRI